MIYVSSLDRSDRCSLLVLNCKVLAQAHLVLVLTLFLVEDLIFKNFCLFINCGLKGLPKIETLTEKR